MLDNQTPSRFTLSAHVRRLHHQHQAVHRRAALDGLERADQDRTSGEVHVHLGQMAAEAAARAGRNDCPPAGHTLDSVYREVLSSPPGRIEQPSGLR